jgi:hypothetical protein
MKKSINIKPKLTGKQQQVQLQKNIVENDTFFPKGVHIEDIDRAVINTIKSDFEVQSNGEAVPIFHFFSIEKYTEFMQTWKNTDETKTVKLPFVALTKDMAKKGTNLGGTYNVPSIPKFNLWRRPVMRNGKLTTEYYQIAQPVNVDINYTIHFFTESQRDLNKLDELILHQFRESQYYVNVNQHYMPLKLEGMDDESQISDLEQRRYYHRTYTLVIKGYLVREEDYKKLSSIDNIKIHINPSTVKNSRECIVNEEDLDCDLCLNFQFNRKAGNSKTYRVPMDLEFYYDNQSSNNQYSYFLNSQLVELPFIAKAGDELTVAHAIQTNRILNIKVCGRKLT